MCEAQYSKKEKGGYLKLFSNINYNSTNFVDMNISVPGYLGIMVTRQEQFCCIFAVTKDKFDYFLKKLNYVSENQ